MDRLATLVKEKDAALKAAKDSGLSNAAFGVYWALKDEPLLRSIPSRSRPRSSRGISTLWRNQHLIEDGALHDIGVGVVEDL